MSLVPGCRLAIAPHFHLPIDWSERLQLSSGLQEEDGRVVPRLPWRSPTEAELSVLIAEVVEADSCVQLFHLPAHLQAQCEALFEQPLTPFPSPPGGEGEGVRGFGEFANQVAAFLEFKHLPPPTTMELMVCRPGQSSINCDAATGNSMGFRCTSVEGRARQWGQVNLGVEPASVLLIARADYPALRLQLAPGEGVCFPSTPLLVDGTTLDKEEPECWLMMFAEIGR